MPAAKASVRTMPKLSPPSDGRDEQVGRGQRLRLLGVGDLAQDVDALRAVEQERLDLVAVGADDHELDVDVVAQRLEGAQQDREPLALDGLADEGEAQRRARRPRRERRQLGRHVDAVGDDPVAAAVEAPAGPGGGLGDGDAHVQALELALGAEGVADRVGDDVLGVAVEGADERRELRVERVVAHDGSDRLVHVDDVEAARAQLAAQRRDRVRRVREVRDGAVGLDADRAPQRDDPVRELARLGPGTTMHPRRQSVGRVIGGEHAHVVAAGHELLGQGLDVAGDAARVAPRVRRHEGDPHPDSSYRPCPAAMVRQTRLHGPPLSFVKCPTVTSSSTPS